MCGNLFSFVEAKGFRKSEPKQRFSISEIENRLRALDEASEYFARHSNRGYVSPDCESRFNELLPFAVGVLFFCRPKAERN
jgi:hypothetical protein